MGLSKLRITQKQKTADEKLFSQKKAIAADYDLALGIGVDTTGQSRNKKMRETSLRSASTHASHAATQVVSPTRSGQPGGLSQDPEQVRRIIQNALNRKTISQSYHTSIPKFMRS